MASVVTISNGVGNEYEGKLTLSVLITCLMAASGGLIFGYDIGISGGVSTMEPFLESFFPSVLKRTSAPSKDQYCVYNSQALTAFTSSLYIAGFVSALVAGRVNAAVGRRNVMLIGGATFFVGAAINAASVNIEMLILGRLLLGVGVGFTNQATPVYLAETAPPQWRGAFSTGFQFFIGIGVVASSVVNYFSSRLFWGWRLSLGFAALPATILFISAYFIPDTPTSLLQRNQYDEARAALTRIRGVGSEVETELDDINETVENSKKLEQGAFRKILFQRKYRPYLTMAIAVPLFQQLTGIVVIAFFSPVLFRTVGFEKDPALMGAVILGAVNLGSILVSTILVDRFGRKVLFIQGGIQMILCQVAVAIIMGVKTGSNGESVLPKAYALSVLVLTCSFTAGFGWSWGPLSWLISSEIFPVEIRSPGQSIGVAVNLGFTFVQTQVFLSMLCKFKYATFLFYASWVVVMTVFIGALLPETKGVALESMGGVWKKHWYWNRFLKDEDDETGNGIVI